jgi:hypothetical protein
LLCFLRPPVFFGLRFTEVFGLAGGCFAGIDLPILPYSESAPKQCGVVTEKKSQKILAEPGECSPRPDLYFFPCPASRPEHGIRPAIPGQ